MKKAILGFLLLAISLNYKAQSDTLSLIQVYNSFNEYEKAEWTSFMNDWNYFDYSSLLKSQHIQSISCKKCSALYADVYLEVDAKGSVKKATVLKGKKCVETLTDKVIIDWFAQSIKKRTFVALKNKKFVARFGHVLKC